MSLMKRCTLSLAVAVATLAPTAAMAQASTPSVQKAIRSQDKAVLESAAVKKILTTGQVSKAQLPKIITLFGALERKLSHAATVVSKASAPTAADKTGQTDWVTAKRMAAKAIGMYVVAFKDVEHNHKAAANTEGKKAIKLIIAADKLILKADKALKLPVGT